VSEHDDLHKMLMKLTARTMALETLLLTVISQASNKVEILKAFEDDLSSLSERTLFDSELKDYPEAELPVAYDNLFVQVTALCQ
jgi:hypothetical protein